MTAISFEKLQQENTRLLTLIGQYERTIEQQKSSIQNLHHQLHLFRSARFGRKSEKSVVLEQYAFVFDEAHSVETDISDVTQKPETETITYTRSKHKTGRKPLPKSLPYLEKIHDLADADKQCACGCALTHIGNEITEQLDVVPQMTFRVVHVRKKYACKGCENTIQLAQKPKQPIDKAIAAPGLLAAVIDAKFNRHMPLYRFEPCLPNRNYRSPAAR